MSDRSVSNIFKDIIKDNWCEFKKVYPKYDHPQYEKAITKMISCGSDLGGYSEYICMNCGERRQVCFSCKSAFCLSCSKVYVDNFVSSVSKMLHPGVIYRHVVLTIPEQLRSEFYRNRTSGALLSEFMKAGYACLEDTVSFLKGQTLKIGAVIIAQSHGRSGSYNPHQHIIMTDGGINEATGKWIDLGFLAYNILRNKWKYYLLNMMKSFVNTAKMDKLIDQLWKLYPNGFVANVQKGIVPESCRGLARYLARYIASPPISISRIVSYDGKMVKYWYNDHKSKSKKFAEVDVLTFVGRMVQHIMPKSFQRVRYYGLQSTRCFKKWSSVIIDGLKRVGRSVAKGSYQIVSVKRYRERYKESGGHDPMICKSCGCFMELFRMWFPKYGFINYMYFSGVPLKDFDGVNFEFGYEELL